MFVQNRLKSLKRIRDIAPWITNTMKLFENDDDNELLIVSQHEWQARTKSFKKTEIFIIL